MTDFLMTRLDIYEFIYLELFPIFAYAKACADQQRGNHWLISAYVCATSISLRTNFVIEQIQKQLNQ